MLLLTTIFLLAVGLFTAKVIIDILILTFRAIFNWVKEKIRNRNANSIAVVGTEVGTLTKMVKNAMADKDSTHIDVQQKLRELGASNTDMVDIIYDKDQDKIVDVGIFRPKQVDPDVKNALVSSKNGVLVMENF